MSLFGHHHTDPTPALSGPLGPIIAHVSAFVHDMPAVVWAGVLGVIGGVATPVVGHLLDSRREKAKNAAEHARRTEETHRTNARVVTDVRARLKRHLHLLQHQAAPNGKLDLHAWESSHDDLARRAREPDVIDTFGVHYNAFADALVAEAVAISAARQGNVVDKRLANVMRAYAPFLRALGDEQTASETERLATRF